MTNTFGRFMLAGLLVGLAATAASGQARPDARGSKDHPLVSRYPGSWILGYEAVEFDEVIVPLGKLDAQRKPEKSQRVEGKVTRIEYRAPKGRSVLEVYRNYEMALQQGGFQTLFACANETCGFTGQPRFWGDRIDNWAEYPNRRHLTAKLSRAEGDAYVSLHVQGADEPGILLYVVEAKPMEAGLVTVDAAVLAGDISRAGHVAVYGIYFDTGKADVKPESDAALTEIAKLLKNDPRLKLHVVGHTDSAGTLPSNMDLSKRRADAVAKVLTTKYNIATTRLDAYGVGPLAPVASNDSEEGRAKNRRVELVKQ